MIAASIIIPCFNQLEFTRHCFRALFRHTRPPFELIAIDNRSTDGTGVYLAGVQDIGRAPVTVIGNARNIGFPAAVNHGLKVPRGGYLYSSTMMQSSRMDGSSSSFRWRRSRRI